MSAIKEFYHEEICSGIDQENETLNAEFNEFEKDNDLFSEELPSWMKEIYS